MYTILIVEDDQLNYELASELLEHAGHSTLRAEDLHQCLDAINSQKPDLILMDIELPGANGLDITKKLKNNPDMRDIPVIAFSAKVMEEDKHNAFNAGCSGFISKPFKVKEFVSTVTNFINSNKFDYKPDLDEKTVFSLNAESKNIQPASENKKHNILVVDDNEMNADILKETLELIGQDVKIAYSGESAFHLLEKEEFDLVLLDIMIPDISGFELIKKFKANPKTADLPVIFVSALDKTSDIVKGFNLGSYEYIVKPYKIEELKARVLSILKIKDLQDQLKSEKKILDLIFKFSEDGIVLLNQDLEIVSCNNMFLNWLGKNNEEILTEKFCKILSYSDENCPLIICESDSYFDFEIENQNTHKKKFIEANCSKISVSSENTEGGYVLVLRDVTNTREIEAQKETFVATLTHDLKTPVRAQTRALEMLIDGKFGEVEASQAEILNETLNSNKYMFGMLDNLLSTYKYENGNVDVKKQDVDVNSLITSCYKELKHLAEDKKHKVNFNFEENYLNTYVDPIEMKRVFSNLIINAINYTDEQGEIIISTKKETEKTVISFTDNGRGLSEKEILGLFDKFTSYSKKFRQVGTGLGLYLSKKILESHGGEIFVESEEGKGSCFTVALPHTED